jgi:alginate O-acetyltransferase complex protein AlgI
MYAGMIGLHGFAPSAEMAWQVSRLSLAMLAVALVAVWPGRWLAGLIAAAAPSGARVVERAWIALVPLFVIALLKVLAESYAPVLYGQF